MTSEHTVVTLRRLLHEASDELRKAHRKYQQEPTEDNLHRLFVVAQRAGATLRLTKKPLSRIGNVDLDITDVRERGHSHPFWKFEFHVAPPGGWSIGGRDSWYSHVSIDRFYNITVLTR